MAIPQQFIQELLARTDVVAVVGRYVKLKKSGANYAGLCPFHSEKTASFTVSPNKQFYHCFGCGKSGNAIGFLMDYTGAGFVEAVSDLAAQQGLTVPDEAPLTAQQQQHQKQKRKKQASITDLLARAATAYQRWLREAPIAIDYLKRRGIDGQTARDFGLGWAPDDWQGLANVFADYDKPLLEAAGLIIQQDEGQKRRYDRFRARIMFPIRDVKGQIIGFGGRALGDVQPKYLNSPETDVFHKGRELYHLFEARQAIREEGLALVVEGYMDVLALAQYGLGHAVASLGTALTADHLRLLLRFTDAVTFSFDGDAAGRAAAAKALAIALRLATDTRQFKFLFLPRQHDPDSFLREQGAQAFRQAAATAIPLSQFLLQTAAAGCDLDWPEGRARFAAQARPLWQQLPRGLLAGQLLTQIAAKIHIGPHELQALWKTGGTGTQAPTRKSSSPDLRQVHIPRPQAASGSGLAPGNQRGRRALQILLNEAGLWTELSHQDKAILCAMPEPWGGLCSWLDRQITQFGPKPWQSLKTALKDHPQEALMYQLAEQASGTTPDHQELLAILHEARPRFLQSLMNKALAERDMQAYQDLLAKYTKIKLG